MKRLISITIFLLLIASGAWAADSKLSALTALEAAPAGTDQLYINDGGVSKRITIDYLFDYIEATALTITANWVNTTNPWADNEVSDTLTASIVTDGDRGDISITTGTWSIDASSVGDDEIDYSAVTASDFAYTTAWRMAYGDASKVFQEFALGANGTFLEFNGVDAAPAARLIQMEDISDLALDGTPANQAGFLFQVDGDGTFSPTNTIGSVTVSGGTASTIATWDGSGNLVSNTALGDLTAAGLIDDDKVQPDDIEYIVEESYIPVSYMTDGASAPDALATLTSGTDKVDARTFAGDADEDLLFIWQAPQDLDTTSGIKFRVVCLVSSATGPSSETWQFEMHGFSLGDGDALDGTLGTAMTSNSGSRTDAQYDRVATTLSAAMTATHITDLAAGETVHFKLYRDVDDTDTYVQNVAVLGIELKYKRNLITTF